MRNFLLFSVLAALIVITALVACTKSSKENELKLLPSENAKSSIQVKANKNSFRLSEKESFAIIKSAEAQNLISLQNEFLDKINIALNKGVRLDEIRRLAIDAVINNNESEFYTLIFNSEVEGKKFVATLQRNRSEFLQKYKVFNQIKPDVTCTDCQKTTVQDINNFFSKFHKYDKNRLKNLKKLNNESSNASSIAMVEEEYLEPDGDVLC